MVLGSVAFVAAVELGLLALHELAMRATGYTWRDCLCPQCGTEYREAVLIHVCGKRWDEKTRRVVTLCEACTEARLSPAFVARYKRIMAERREAAAASRV